MELVDYSFMNNDEFLISTERQKEYINVSESQLKIKYSRILLI